MTEVLHLTPHLGGGIGKAISGLVKQSTETKSEFRHAVVCLEKPIRYQYIDKIHECRDEGKVREGKIIICPTYDELEKLMKESDIVQLNWINHPVIIKYLNNVKCSFIRLITWCHNNGLYSDNIKEPGKLPPIIPEKLILASDKFIFTTECSFDAKVVKKILEEHPYIRKILGIVYSSGGFGGLLDPELKDSFSSFSSDSMSVGYFGTINFAKIHLKYVDFLEKVDIPGFKVKIVGEISEEIRNQLNKQCKEIGKSGMLEFTGYIEKQEELIKELSKINVLAYILNPRHYGTTENALLETMSMGIVPIVLNNLPEKYLVEDRKTGFVVKDPKEFGEVIRLLYENPDERQRIGLQSARYVRKNFTAEKTINNLNFHYRNMMKMKKRDIDFTDIFRLEDK